MRSAYHKLPIDEKLESVLAAEYPPEQRHGLDLGALFQPHIHLFVACMDGEAVGCGAVASFPGFAEVKRMFVRESARGKGIADALLAKIEATARAVGRGKLRLETGTRQHAALRFYERSGFRRCEAFGDYAKMTPHATETSVFMEKDLT